MFDLRPYVARYGIPDDLDGMRVLDVGTFEGFWAFELERRGADVVALDVGDIDQLDWPVSLRPREGARRGEGFAIAARALGSSVERVEMPIYDLDPKRVGRFDLVFCGSVLMHVRDPILALERMASVCDGRLILAEEYSRRLALVPFAAAEFRGHSPWMTWWRPSLRTWLTMVETAGWRAAKRHARFRMAFRAQRGAVPHVVVHAAAPTSR
jgi:tRNA (mo5U34)-methyltransferase